MSLVFLSVLRISLTAALAAVVVLFARLLLKGAPRWITCLLWALVALRLACPVLPESELSIVPEKVYYAEDVALESVQTDLAAVLNDVDSYKVNVPVESEATIESKADKYDRAVDVFGYVWLGGASLMLLYGTISYLCMKRRFADAVLVKDNIRMSEKVNSPFVMGFIKPCIYIPFNIDKKTCKQVLLHEQAHIKRFDHISKPLGFALLCLHWFNPLVWVSYILFCRDVEVACDEKVIKNYELKQKKAYATALLECKMPSRLASAQPLAFGEVGVGARIKKTLSYRKPAAVIAVFSLVLTFALSLCLLTNPVSAVADEVVRNYSSDRVTQEYIENMQIQTDPQPEPEIQNVTQAQTEPQDEFSYATVEAVEDSYYEENLGADSYEENSDSVSHENNSDNIINEDNSNDNNEEYKEPSVIVYEPLYVRDFATNNPFSAPMNPYITYNSSNTADNSSTNAVDDSEKTSASVNGSEDVPSSKGGTFNPNKPDLSSFESSNENQNENLTANRADGSMITVYMY